MTTAMPDSVRPEDMPGGYSVYLAYVDGARSKDYDVVRAGFPGARILTLTVIGGTTMADGCDREPGDLSPVGAARWLKWRAGLTPGFRPVLYDSRDDVPGTLAEAAALGVQRPQIRIISAHYGAGEHICSPAACGASFTADGTQWTDAYPGVAGARIDMSALDDGFFGAAAPAPQPTTWTEIDEMKLPILKTGATGQAVRNWQGILVAHGYGYLIADPGGADVEARAGIDGQFGAKTDAATRKLQADLKVTGGADGEVGANTYARTLGVA